MPNLFTGFPVHNNQTNRILFQRKFEKEQKSFSSKFLHDIIFLRSCQVNILFLLFIIACIDHLAELSSTDFGIKW